MNPLGKQILKDVSRSFYLSMRVLPMAMREPISLGYLLARASDTLADSQGLDASLRSAMLAGFEEVLKGEGRTDWLQRLRREVIHLQQHPGEKVLLENMDGVFTWLDSLLHASEVKSETHYGAPDSQSIGQGQHSAILKVIGHIVHGQRLDIDRFELQQGFRFTLDAELEEYCYLVAGCVGEFWTDVGEISLGKFSRIESARLHRWGANYGKGLQLINILRDLPGDLENGRCYLPGVEPANRDALMAQSARWRARARGYLEEGHDYACSLLHRRTRAATALPGLIGGRTLDWLDAADWQQLEQRVKIPRREVYRCVWKSFFV
ncbi:MAG: squalene/phytoene synthase family protein [Akkermansiaceae bacterium]|nr:squalene/phytoene synthase family protein [Akkermansiaceae bacterium]